jgi:hypothetical protein
MRLTALIVTALVACQGCSSDGTSGGATTDGGDAASGSAGMSGSAGTLGSGGGLSSGGARTSGGANGAGGAGGAAGGGAGGAAKACPLNTTPCTSCLGPKCPDAIQACGTSAACLDSLSSLVLCVCPAAPNGKTSDQCLIDLAARGAIEAPFAKCMQTAPECRSLCGL